MDRREFLRNALLAGVGVVALGGCRPGARGGAADSSGTAGKVGRNRWQAGPVKGVDLAVARGKAPAELVAAALGVFGGIAAFVRPGDRVFIKPNLAWGRTPEQGAGTSPEVLEAVIAACQQAQAQEIIVGDHTCDSASVTFDMSGAAEVCKRLGVRLVDYASPQLYRPINMLQGKTLRTDLAVADLLDSDVYLNLPILKHHSASLVTVALKNQMGLVHDRQRYHSERGSAGQDNLHRNIVDLATALRPTLNILDATRALKTNGPKGPGVVEELGIVCASPNICAVDAYGAKLLGHDPASIPHIAMASQAGLGEHDLSKLIVKEV
jgi:uncharacterized protein (DUF362 family)